MWAIVVIVISIILLFFCFYKLGSKKVMAKPIFIVNLNSEFLNSDISELIRDLGKELNDYHLLVLKTENEYHSYKCFNDCKGLQDIDIEKLINELKNKK